VFCGSWSLAEWLRGHLLSGFPWNLAGYIWTVADEPLQAASVVGIYGLSFATVALCSLPALALRTGARSFWRSKPLAAATLGLLMLWGFGVARLHNAEDRSVPGVLLRLVQPNVPQELKWKQDQREAILRRYVDLSAQPANRQPTYVIWPESAVPFLLLEGEQLRREIAERVQPEQGVLMGAVRRVVGAGERTYYFNSVLAIDTAGEVVATYDKVRLVPFGEYMPFQGLIPLQKLTAGKVDFSSGPGPRTNVSPGLLPFQPLVCYEAIFPDDQPSGELRPEWLLNVTNDAWFGDSAGPYQHFQMARVRAVERGIPLVRAANTGVSAVIDAYGRVRTSLPLNTEGILDAALPQALAERTFYARAGNVVFFVMMTGSLLLGVLAQWTAKAIL
jgi:apolipoprotein N-acyltransferase